MKFKAKQKLNGEWAVFTGSKFFIDTVSHNENETIILACEMSAQWHQAQMDKCQNMWRETHGRNKPDMKVPDWGDVLC